MATVSSILAWRIPWTEEPWRATVHRVAKSQTLSDILRKMEACDEQISSLPGLTGKEKVDL